MTHHSFVVMDLEHCNSSYASVCAIGAVRVTDNVVVARRHFMVRPREPFDVAHTRHLEMTGLTLNAIAAGRDFADVAPTVVRSIGDSVLVLHNRHADMPMWQQASLACGLELPTFRVLDTVELAQQLGLPRRLNLLYQHFFGTELDGHHSADADAEATALLAMKMLDMAGVTADDMARPHRFKPMTLADVKLPKMGRRLPPK